MIVFERIIDFETKNRELLGNLDSFDRVILNLSQAIQQKRELTRRELARVLAESMQNITYSKRSGEIARVTESRRKWSVSKFISKFDFELFRGVKVWLLTPEVVSEIIPLQTGLFDLVIFDEASQMYIEKGVPAILRAKKVVIAGDHKQLRPSKLGAGRIETDDDLTEEEAEDSSAALEEESLLDLARFRYKPVLLPVMFFTCAALSRSPLLGSEMFANRIPAKRAMSSVGFWLLTFCFMLIVSGRTVLP